VRMITVPARLSGVSTVLPSPADEEIQGIISLLERITFGRGLSNLPTIAVWRYWKVSGAHSVETPLVATA
jgi:hypothetical protein